MATPPTRVPLTLQGKLAIEAELQKIKSVDRPRNIKAIEEARAHGDLSENAEYSAAKEQQGQIEARLRLLEDQLARCEVIPPQTGTPTRVVFGVATTLVDAENGREITYRIVGELESAPQEFRISFTSPIGKALIGKQVGDEVQVQTPGGTRNYEVIAIKP